MTTCNACGSPVFGGQAWGDMTCGDCIADQLRFSLAALSGLTVLGPMKPARRAPRETVEMPAVEAPRRASNG